MKKFCRRLGIVLFLFSFLFIFPFNKAFSAPTPFDENANVSIELTSNLSVSSNPEDSESSAQEILKNGIQVPQDWRGSDQDRSLVNGARYHTSANDLILLLNKTQNKDARDQILLVGIRTPKNFQEISQLYANANSPDVANKILLDNVDKITDFGDLLKLANLAKSPNVRDAILLKGISKAQNLSQLITLSQRCYFPENCDQALLLGSSIATSSYDFFLMSNRTKTPTGKDRIIESGLGKCQNFEEVVDLGWTANSVSVKDKSAEEAVKYAKSQTDLQMAASLAGSPQEKDKISKLTLPDGNCSYRDRAKFMSQLSQKWGINIHDNTSTGFFFTYDQLIWIDQTLISLPKEFLSYTHEIFPMNNGSPFVFGQTVQNFVKTGNDTSFTPQLPFIRISDTGCREEKLFKGTLVHEMTHSMDYQLPGLLESFVKQFWPSAKAVSDGVTINWQGSPESSSVSDYGNSMPREDLAESARMFWAEPNKMKAQFPDRYQFIKDNVFKMEFLI
ncbi:MAG: hypothetical protein HQM08_02675 [Candidatus Riflebacteria bacterium]|nr:hypothetical protein [Candidatus Riflebacteria bacterium]